MTFPRDFAWGAATAAFQIEGATHADGRGESIWDRFAATEGKVARGETGDPAEAAPTGGEEHHEEQRGADEDDRAAQLRLHGVEIRLEFFGGRAFGQPDVRRSPFDGPLSTRSPREYLEHEHVLHRGGDSPPREIIRPPRMSPVPRLQVRVLHSPRFHRLYGPFTSGFQVRRPGHPRPVHIGEEVQRTHDLGMVESFVPDPRVDRRAGFCGALLGSPGCCWVGCREVRCDRGGGYGASKRKCSEVHDGILIDTAHVTVFEGKAD